MVKNLPARVWSQPTIDETMLNSISPSTVNTDTARRSGRYDIATGVRIAFFRVCPLRGRKKLDEERSRGLGDVSKTCTDGSPQGVPSSNRMKATKRA
jgi:hypothetical protein